MKKHFPKGAGERDNKAPDRTRSQSDHLHNKASQVSVPKESEFVKCEMATYKKGKGESDGQL